MTVTLQSRWIRPLGTGVLICLSLCATARAQVAKPVVPAGGPAVTSGFAELNPENFVAVLPPDKYGPDETALREEQEERQPATARPGVAEPMPRNFFRDAPLENLGGHPVPYGFQGPSPTLSLVRGPFQYGPYQHDPQVAAGDSLVAVIEAHTASFYDKNGKLHNLMKGASAITSYDIFERFLLPKNKDGSINQDNINLAANFPTNARLYCDLSSYDPQNPGTCVNEVYDLRVAYDLKHKRFIFVGNARNQIQGCGKNYGYQTDNNGNNKTCTV